MSTHEKNENETAPADPATPDVAATGPDEPQATEPPTTQHPTTEPQDTQPQASPPAGASDPASHQAVGIGVIDSEEGSDHFGQDEGRGTLTAGQAQREAGGLGTEQEQRLPAMSQNDASAVDKVAGIVAQTRQDVGTQSVDEIAHVLGQRLEQSGVPLPDSDVQELARQISTGDAAAPDHP
jgi:hypothetical protein